MNLTFAPSVEGQRALRNGEVVAVIFAPKQRGGDYWCRISASGDLHKGLTLEAAMRLVRDKLRLYDERRAREKWEAANASKHLQRPRLVDLPARTSALEFAGGRAYGTASRHASMSSRRKGPKKQAKPATSAPHSLARPSIQSTSRMVATSPALSPCPQCGVMIGNPKKHYRKRHPELAVPGRTVPGAPPTSTAASAPGHRVTRAGTGIQNGQSVISGQRPVVSYARKLTLAVRRTNGKAEVICPVCRLLTTPDRIWEHLSRLHPTVNHEEWQIETRKRSPSARSNETSPSHERKARAKGSGNQRPTRPKVKRSGHKFRVPQAPRDERFEHASDATRLYAERYRERGRFGSHSSHDGYDGDDAP